jgi:hypothetical protein
LDLVQRVGLDGGWQPVKAAANAGNVLTRRSVGAMQVQYSVVKGLLRQNLPAEKLDALSLDLEKRVGRRGPWTEDEHVELLDLVQRSSLDGGWQSVKAAAYAGNVLTRRSADAMKQQYCLVKGLLRQHLSAEELDALSLNLEKRVGGGGDKWTEDENVVLLDLVERVGFDGGWKGVKEAANAGNVLTRRNVGAMTQQYSVVKGLLRQHLSAEELDALSLDLEKRVGGGGDKWTEDENVVLRELVERVGFDGGARARIRWQAVEVAAKAGNVLTRKNVRGMQQQYSRVMGRLHKPLKKRSKSAENTADKENKLRWRLVEAL